MNHWCIASSITWAADWSLQFTSRYPRLRVRCCAGVHNQHDYCLAACAKPFLAQSHTMRIIVWPANTLWITGQIVVLLQQLKDLWWQFFFFFLARQKKCLKFNFCKFTAGAVCKQAIAFTKIQNSSCFIEMSKNCRYFSLCSLKK